ncbi:glycoside hydrolase family 3 protein [Collybiopsis luxurians FD-317 M1]|uniref:beta-glucosidase n=1 Tax=Collybiopsis luxurians FD-317 M1 TaxID=944289 RepID=A0A0D0BY97_9AGAR|nr:glycoside hydrolase family 3 protein [Collybiopsis luxurians FD-317 M1]
MLLPTLLACLALNGLGGAIAQSSSTPMASATASSSSSLSSSSSSSYNDTAILSSGHIDLGEWQDAYEQASAFVSSLTNEEKVLLITKQDITDKNFTALTVVDSTVAPNNYYFVSTFPCTGALAMTWDKDLIYTVGNAIGSEHYSLGINLLDGPVTAPLGRIPWGGRNDESFGPDAYLNGAGFGRMVAGISDAGTMSIGMHLILYEQETNRTGGSSGIGGGGGAGSTSSPPGGGQGDNQTSTSDAVASGSTSAPSSQSGAFDSSASGSTSDSYNVLVDDKALHETYLRPWYDGVKNGLGGAMCAMNLVNGTRSCESAEVMNHYLKTEIGFPGFMTADVNGQQSSYNAANSGLDVSSTQYWSNETILDGISNGSLSQTRLDDMAIRNVMAWYKSGQSSGMPAYISAQEYSKVRANHSAVIRDTAAQSIVLLKNNGVLPLGNDTLTMALFGAHAGPAVGGPNFEFSVTGTADTYQGHLAAAGGSGTGSMSYLVTPHHALTNIARENGMMLFWIMNNTWTSSSGGGIAGVDFSGGTGTSITYADYAEQAEVSIVFINAWSGEGADRSELRDTEQDELVTTIAASCNNTIVVVNTVGPRILDSWIENENITAVLYGSMLGQESGNSIVDVLYGRINPSGRLPYTIAKNESDYSQFAICITATCNFTEGNLIDYKWFDALDVTPRYEFGYGLSYTTFSYQNFSVQANSDLAAGMFTGAYAVGGRTDLWDNAATITLSVTNNGTVAGAEIVQLYMTYPDVADQPIRQLRGFEKISIEPGASGTVTFQLLKRDFAFWNVTAQEWGVASGQYNLYGGASSRDLRVQTTLRI